MRSPLHPPAESPTILPGEGGGGKEGWPPTLWQKVMSRLSGEKKRKKGTMGRGGPGEAGEGRYVRVRAG